MHGVGTKLVAGSRRSSGSCGLSWVSAGAHRSWMCCGVTTSIWPTSASSGLARARRVGRFFSLATTSMQLAGVERAGDQEGIDDLEQHAELDHRDLFDRAGGDGAARRAAALRREQGYFLA